MCIRLCVFNLQRCQFSEYTLKNRILSWWENILPLDDQTLLVTVIGLSLIRNTISWGNTASDNPTTLPGHAADGRTTQHLHRGQQDHGGAGKPGHSAGRSGHRALCPSPGHRDGQGLPPEVSGKADHKQILLRTLRKLGKTAVWGEEPFVLMSLRPDYLIYFKSLV